MGRPARGSRTARRDHRSGGLRAGLGDTAFGRIDLFVLRRSGTEWVWRDVRFRPEQFAPASFAIVADLPENTVLAIRRPDAGTGTG
jgi:hypothetical protein